MRNTDIGRIGNLNLIFFNHAAMLQIHIINPDAVFVLISDRVSRDIRYIFILFHKMIPPFAHYSDFIIYFNFC